MEAAQINSPSTEASQMEDTDEVLSSLWRSANELKVIHLTVVNHCESWWLYFMATNMIKDSASTCDKLDMFHV